MEGVLLWNEKADGKGKALGVGHEQQREARRRREGSGTTGRWFVMRGQDKGQGLSPVQMTHAWSG